MRRCPHSMDPLPMTRTFGDQARRRFPLRPFRRALTVLLGVLLVGFASTAGQTVTVRHQEGMLHGFLTLRTLDVTLLADGDLIQQVHGDQITSEVVFHFKDGSLHSETTTFSQRGAFKMVSNHLV